MQAIRWMAVVSLLSCAHSGSSILKPCQKECVMMSQKADSQNCFLILENATLCGEVADLNTFYIKGHMKNERFVPESGVLGEGRLNAPGTPGWMEIETGHFYPMQTAKSPASPYVLGHMTDKGFVPSSKEVH